MARRAYRETDPGQIGWWLNWLRAICLLQALTWSLISGLMLFALGPTDKGYLVVACGVGWTMASPAIIATDLWIARMLCVVNAMPLVVWTLFGSASIGWIPNALSVGLMGVGFLLTNLQHSYMRGMFSVHIQLEEAHLELQAAKDKAEEAAAAKGQFLANMSHEIRTPLNGVIGLSEMLYQSDLGAAQRELAADLRRSGQQLLAIVNDVLDLSKISANRMAVERVSMSPTQIVRDCATTFHALALEKGLLLTWQVAADVPEFILGDAVQQCH